MSKFVRYDFSPEVIERFKAQKEIPVHFYNKDGQILIYKKDNASDTEIERILRFIEQGIYYNTEDSERLGIEKKAREIPEGLTDTKLLTEQHAEELSRDTEELFNKLKRSSITSLQATKSSERLANVFNDFENQPDAMTGLVNIIELLKGRNSTYESELAVKRTVVAMAMKTRGMQAQSFRDKKKMHEMVSNLMMSALLCDIGYMKMNMPLGSELTRDQMNYISNHPIMSYLMIVHEPSINVHVKHNILNHHRPMRDVPFSNNYPEGKWLRNKLTNLEQTYRADASKKIIADDVAEQLVMYKHDMPYDEDANILALASEFASLTSKVPWREAFSPARAVRMIVNNSYFTYSNRILREFLDYVSISMCDNEKILKDGDFIVVAMKTQAGKTYFEVCQITASSRYQSRPGVNRIATITPDIVKSPKLKFAGFNMGKLKQDPRNAHYELAQDDSRHIVYAVDPDFDAEFHKGLTELAASRKRTF